MGNGPADAMEAKYIFIIFYARFELGESNEHGNGIEMYSAVRRQPSTHKTTDYNAK